MYKFKPNIIPLGFKIITFINKYIFKIEYYTMIRTGLLVLKNLVDLRASLSSSSLRDSVEDEYIFCLLEHLCCDVSSKWFFLFLDSSTSLLSLLLTDCLLIGVHVASLPIMSVSTSGFILK